MGGIVEMPAKEGLRLLSRIKKFDLVIAHSGVR